MVPAFTANTATGGPGIVARSLDYAAAEVVVDLEVMRGPMWVLIRPDDA